MTHPRGITMTIEPNDPSLPPNPAAWAARVPAILASAAALLDSWEGLHDELDYVEGAEGRRSGEPEREADRRRVAGLLAALKRDWQALAARFDEVCDSWVADQPPHFQPSAAFVLEGTLRESWKLAYLLESAWPVGPAADEDRPPGGATAAPEFASFAAVGRLVRRRCERPIRSQLAAALRCEATRVQEKALSGVPAVPLPGVGSRPYSAWLVWELFVEAADAVPEGWPSMSDAGRVASLEGPGAAGGGRRGKGGRPRSELVPQIGAYAQGLYDADRGGGWKGVAARVNAHFNTEHAEETIVKYAHFHRQQQRPGSGQ